MAITELTVAKLASLALANPTQRETLARESHTLERALHGHVMPIETLTAQDVGLSEREWGKQRHELRQNLGAELSQGGMDLFQRGPNEREIAVPDPEILRDQLARNQQTLQRATPPDLTVHQKNQLWQLAKRLKDEIAQGMPSYEQLERPTHENIEVFTRHQERTIHKQLALRNIIRMLDHQDETAVIETLRPTEPSRIDWGKWFGNFDEVFSTPEHELRLTLDTLDEETYRQYVTLRLKGVETPRLFMERLHCTQAVHDACKARLEQELAAIDVDEDEDDASASEPAATVTVAVPQRPASPPKRSHRSKAAQAAKAAKAKIPTPSASPPLAAAAADMSAFAAAS